MAFTTIQERQRALGAGFPLMNFPYPDGTVDGGDRAYLWGSFFSIFPPNEYYVADYVGRMQSLLIEQFQPKPAINGVVESIGVGMQRIESMWNDFLRFRYVDSAFGAQLDIIGEIVGQEREGRDDADYRAAIKARISVNISNGEPDSVIEAVKFFTDADRVLLHEFYPASINVFSNGAVLPGNLFDSILAVRPAGVNLMVTWCPGTNWFEFDGEGGVPNPEGNYFSESLYLESGNPIGGEFVDVIE